MSFYSPIDRLAQSLPRPKGTGSEFMTELSKMPGYKAQEAEDRGLQALVNLPKMERAQFLEALKAKPPVTPLPRDTQEEHHEAYTLPGGKNYREILLQHPNSTFKGVSSHFGGAPNILASVRAKDRTGPNGEKILHIEELQSDWHQQGREKGYTPPDVSKRVKDAERARRELKKQLEEAKQNAAYAEAGLSDPTTKRMRDLNPEMNQRLEAAKLKHNDSIMELMPQYMKAEAEHQDLLIQSYNTVPDAPFKKSWHEMALKKMIHHAAENGYDSLAITPGREQADRYGMAKHIGRIAHMANFDNPSTGLLIAYDPKGYKVFTKDDVPHEKLAEYIGKEGVQKLMEQKPDEDGYRELSGQDLHVGGEGLKGFYDKIVPNFLNQFGKKYGAKVGQIQVPVTHELQGLRRANGYPDDPPLNLHHFPITPEMREDVTKNGVPLYAKGGEVEVKPTNYDPNLQRKHPELEAAIRGIAAGTTTHKQLDKLIAKHKPIKPYEFVPQPATDEDAERALKPAQKPKWRGHEQWPAGRKVGLRLDIPAYETHGVWVNSVHDEEGKGDDNLKVAYGPVSSVKNAVFDPTPHKAEEVGMGEKGKSSFARIKGDLHHMSEDEAVDHMKTYLNHPDYAQVGFDPRRHGHFYDRKTMKPVTHSAHVVQIGPLVLAHKPTYGKRENYATGGPVPPLRPLNPQLAAMREQLAAQSALHKAYDEAMKNVYTNQMPTFAQWVASQGKAKGGRVLYHGTPYTDKVIKKFEVRGGGDFGPGIYMTTSPKSASDFSKGMQGDKYGAVYPLLASIKNPLRVKDKYEMNSVFDRLGTGKPIHETLQAQGYDGIHVTNPNEKDPDEQYYVAFHPKQVKSSITGKAKGGRVKPVGYTKEQVTVSPSLDAMRYELMSVKRYTKKVK